MRFLPVTLHSLLVELADLDETLALLESLQRTPLVGVEELVPAARTILVRYQPSATSAAALVQQIAQRDLSQRTARAGTLVEIPVHYTGEDLAEVAQLLGISPQEVVRRHTGSEYTVAFTGFAPGFAYLSGGDPSLNVPRRSTPRTRLPAGSVGLAGTFSGVYPQASPGGWQIIGTTPVAMWDIQRAQPALLQPGYRVRFVDVTTQKIAVSAYPESAEVSKDTKSSACQLQSLAAGKLDCTCVPPGCRPCFRIWGATVRPGRGYRPLAPWTRPHSRPPTGWWATPATRPRWKPWAVACSCAVWATTWWP